MSRNSHLYSADDYDDFYDDGGDYDEYDVAPQPKPKAAPKSAGKPAGKAGGKAAAAASPAAAAGASALARALVDAPPTRPDGKQQQGAKKLPQAAQIKQQPRPLVPEGPAPTGAAAAAAAAADVVQRFGFDQPSPDDVVLAAQQKKGGGPANNAQDSSSSSSSSSTVVQPAGKPYQPLQQQQQQRQQGVPDAAATAPAASSGLAGGMQSLSVGSQQQDQQYHQQQQQAEASDDAAPGASKQQQQREQQQRARRPLSEYRPDAELQQACARAVAADHAGSGGKPRLHLVVLGHVDAGKSTLMGRMLYELGLITDKAVHKTQREAAATGKASFAWAWMLDERPEERARGVTVDVAVTRFETSARNVTLLDAPGHRDFVPNMIAGAAQADAALLIVDGSPGGFEAGFEPAAPGSLAGGGQTREHAQLARSLGVEQMAVVVTKLDTCDFSQDRFELIKAQLEPFLKTCGFRESSIQWLPAVGPSGDNLVKPPADARLAAWWKGGTLAAAIDAFRPTHRLLEKPLRLPVTDVLRSGKAGVTVGGKLEGGALRVGSRVLVMPSGQQATVKAVEVDGKPASLARAGDSADVTLAGIDATAVGAGSVVCHPDFPVPLAAKFEARVVVLDVQIPILKGQQVTIHAHTARESGHVSGLLSLLNGKTGKVQRARPRCLLKGQSAVVEVTPARPVCVEDYASYRALGRVALRDGGRTIAVGIISAVSDGGT